MAFSAPLIRSIAAFLEDIGLDVQASAIDGRTFVPGIQIQHGVLVVDEAELLYPGDLLHEAGHLAVVPSARRAAIHIDVGKSAGEEMMAIAWSYAAALHLGIEPAIVFHEDGYKGGSSALLENFGEGRYIGVPTLQWLGLTAEPRLAAELGVRPYPHMLKWLAD